MNDSQGHYIVTEELSTEHSDVVVGIVTYTPDIDRLEQNLVAVEAQACRVFIVDNGSSNYDSIESIVANRQNVSIMRSVQNLGVAWALNQLLERAYSEGFPYLLTLDQDSVVSPGMVAALRSNMVEGVAMTTPVIIDRNKEYFDGQDSASPTDEYLQPARRGAITSGALLLVEAARTVGGFDESLFIDYVDYDLNARLILSGYSILRINSVSLLHEVGKARATWLFVPRRGLTGRWRLERFYSFGHSAQRCYFKARNRIIFTKKYGRLLGVSHEGVWQIPQQIALTLLFEDHRVEKMRAFVRGIRDGIRYDLSPVEITPRGLRGI